MVDMENHTLEDGSNVDAIVTTNAFYLNRSQRIIKAFQDFDPGCSYRLIVVHNSINRSNVVNREPDPNLCYDYKKVRDAWATSGVPNEFYNRHNIGEDVGAHQYSWQLHKNNDYKFMFFLGDGAVIYKDGWLKAHLDAYEDPTIGACSPQVCRGIRYPWCLRTSFWSMNRFVCQHIYWPAPQNREESELQEMELVYPQVKAMGLNCKQVGNGTEWMNTVSDNMKPEKWFTFTHEVVV